jgi:hypothetical protein
MGLLNEALLELVGCSERELRAPKWTDGVSGTKRVVHAPWQSR